MAVSVYTYRGADERNPSLSDQNSHPVGTQSMPSASNASVPLSKDFDSSHDPMESRMAKIEQAMDMLAVWRDKEKRRAESAWWKEQILEEKLLQLEARVSRLEGSSMTLAVAEATAVEPAESQEKAEPTSQDLAQDIERWRDDVELKLNALTARTEQMGESSQPPKKQKSWVTVDELVRGHMEYRWECSVYDGLLVVFLSNLRISALQSLMVILGFTMNAFMLGIILFIIGDEEFNQLGFSKDALTEWRVSDGHSHTWAHPLTSHTLVNRVCNLDDSLSFATEQKALYEQIGVYDGKHRGLLLVNVAIILWAFCCALEVRSALRFGAAIWYLPRGEKTEVAQSGGGEGEGLKFTHMSLIRSVMGSGVGIARASFAFALMFFGGTYLANITSIEDLLLNASALGFVLDIDNVIFGVVAPLRVLGCIQQLQPAPLPKSRLMKFLPLGLIFAIGGFTLYENIAAINPNYNNMMEAAKILCAPKGSLKYAIGSSTLGWIMYTKNTPAFGQWIQSPYSPTAQDHIVADFVKGRSNAERFGVPFPDFPTLRYMTGLSTESLVNMFSCADGNTLHNSAATVGDRLWTLTANESYLSLKSCAEARHLCTEMDHWIVGANTRFVCPETCGCASMDSGLWDIARSFYGCPQEHCRKKIDVQLKRFHEAPCKDRNLTHLKQSGWNLLVNRLLATRTINEDLHMNLTTLGCEALKYVPDTYYRRGKVRDVCSMNPDSRDHGAAPFCPESCRCADASSFLEMRTDCPGLCPLSCCR